MIRIAAFKTWLSENTSYSSAVIRDTASRMKRADSILEWNGEETYSFYLEKAPNYQTLSVSVRSQLRKAVKLYSKFEQETQNA